MSVVHLAMRVVHLAMLVVDASVEIVSCRILGVVVIRHRRFLVAHLLLDRGFIGFVRARCGLALLGSAFDCSCVRELLRRHGDLLSDPW